ncbi:Mechanosensitive ion channel [Formosa sp. Hel1_31_208]|uniref:mechanosensitive ion channel family protein n=1 Tax=Formosa sp. Hel1_31_208 TaxID=1798225 RepID=UPI00087AF441|nr:mechanosensitive ion channel domain-containing protein [Formosa sp. Hel1_31_208]SDS22745.1 Mechanosensitive ion channel [Formosa sp. Hel1_31_208]
MTVTFLTKTKTSCFLLILFFSINSFAQNNATIVNDSIYKEIPKAIPVVKIIEEIEIATEEIKEARRKTQPKSFIVDIDSIYPSYKTFILNKRQQALEFISSEPNKQKVNNLLNEWKRYHDYLKSWETTINNQLEKNSIILKDITFNEKTWELTLLDSVYLKTPIEIKTNISSVLEEFKVIKTIIISQNNENLVLESKINYLIFTATDIIEKIEDLKNTNVYNILHKRHSALWNTSFKKTKSSDVTINENAYFGNISLEFLKTFEKLFYLFGFLVLALIYFITYLKKGFVLYQKAESNLKKDTKSIIYKQPWLVIVFISLIVSKVLFLNLPDLINDLLTLLLLIFTIPIVNPTISTKFKKLVYIVILFFILDSAKTYIWFESYQYRIYLLIEAFLVIISLYYFTHPYRQLKALVKTKLSQFLIKLTPIFYLLIIISIISNIIGYTNLTDITLKICTQGIVLSIIFYGILIVIETISDAILHRHYNAKESYDSSMKLNVETKLTKYIRLTLFVIWLLLFLQVLDQLKSILNFFGDILSEPYNIGSITFTIGSIAGFLLILISSFLITKLISFALDEGENTLKFLHLPKGIPRAISVVLRYLILAFGVVFALSSLGLDLSEFNLMAGALGLGIGFGLQNVISNFVSGLILIFERPILPGDTVEVNNLMGTVNKIGVRSSKVSTFDGADVVVPNNNLVSNDLINWTLSSSLKRTEILIGTSYDSNPNQVLEILLECANNYPDLVKDPEPKALFSDFGDNSLNFRLRFWTHFSLSLQAKSDISIAIYNKFKEHNIEIPFPQQDVYIKDFPKPETDNDK